MVYRHLQTRATKIPSRPYQESRLQRLRGRFPRHRREETSERAGFPADSAKMPKVFWKEKVNTPIPVSTFLRIFLCTFSFGLTRSTTFPHFCAWEKLHASLRFSRLVSFILFSEGGGRKIPCISSRVLLVITPSLRSQGLRRIRAGGCRHFFFSFACSSSYDPLGNLFV
jgi:hypothetical protein